MTSRALAYALTALGLGITAPARAQPPPPPPPLPTPDSRSPDPTASSPPEIPARPQTGDPQTGDPSPPPAPADPSAAPAQPPITPASPPAPRDAPPTVDAPSGDTTPPVERPRPTDAPLSPPAPSPPALPYRPLIYRVGDAAFTLYGDFDLYLNYMHSTSGHDIFALQDGAMLRSRLGARGDIGLGSGLRATFALEQGINGTNGAPADATRLFDRQAWAGLVTPIGEFRAGRQSTEVFQRGGYIDYGERTLGAVINAFGGPSRYDSDLSYVSPRIAGLFIAAHYSLAGATVDSPGAQRVYQLAADFEHGRFRVGYARVAGKPPEGAAVPDEITYDNLYANVIYGPGKLYLVYIRSNNNGPAGELLNGGAPLGNTGALVSGDDPGGATTYNIYQLSLDYTVSPALRVGALYGWIRDDSGTEKHASGGSIGGFYVFKNVKPYLLAEVLSNDRNAGFRPIGSAALTKPFTAAADVNGETLVGVHLGCVFRF